MKVLVAGASGFVGRLLVARLEAEAVEVLRGTRSPEGRGPGWVAFDVDHDRGLEAALAGVDALVYLVHQMTSGHEGLLEREEAAAKRVLGACERAGVRRIVYLGGPAPQGATSEHLEARLRTGRILRSGAPSALELRAAMIVGVGSESWTICRDLALRLPVMVLPRWLTSRSQPIAADDVVAALVHALSDPIEGSHWFDLPGPEVLTARRILERIAALEGIRPVMIPVPFLSPGLSSWWLKLVTRADFSVARKLVAGLTSDLVVDSDGYFARCPEVRRLSFDEAAARALAVERGRLPAGARLWEGTVQRVARRAR